MTTTQMPGSLARLTEVLMYDGVCDETRSVFQALLRCCANKHDLSDFVLRSVQHHVQRREPGLHPAILWIHAACLRCQQGSLCLQTAQKTRQLIADGVNFEARRWMSDFLLIGKQNLRSGSRR
jgi:hypothetical protein